MSTRRKHPGGNPARATTGTSLKIEARHRHHATIPPPKAGQHLWVVTGAWVIKDPTSPQMMLDTENLMTIEGPGCFICEEVYTAELATQPCQGEPPA